MGWIDEAKVEKQLDRELKETRKAAEIVRKGELKEAKEATGFDGATLAEAIAIMDNELESASNLAELKEALRQILMKIIPHIVNGGS